MRLTEIFQLLTEQIPRLTIKAEQLSDHNWRITAFRDAVDAARIIASTGVLSKEARAVLEISEIADHVSDTVTVSQKIALSLDPAVRNLRNRAELLQETLAATTTAEPPDAADFRLPDSNDLKDVARDIAEIGKFLEQAFLNQYLDATPRLITFDRGSLWLIIAMGSQAALSFLGGMLLIIYKLRDKEVEIDHKREVVRAIRIQNDAMSAIEAALEQELVEYADQQIAELLAAAGIPVQGEQRERTRNSIVLLSTLIARGVQVLPSYSAPSETKKLFPLPKSIASPVAELTSGEDGAA